VTNSDVIFVLYCSLTETPRKTELRWKTTEIFDCKKHLQTVQKLLMSEDVADRNIGKSMLEQTLKITINSEIIGNNNSELI
jgi:hypothetical protein